MSKTLINSINLTKYGCVMSLDSDLLSTILLISNNDGKFIRKVSNSDLKNVLIKLKSEMSGMKFVITGICANSTKKLVDELFQVESKIVETNIAFENGLNLLRTSCTDDEVEYKSKCGLLEKLEAYKIDPNNAFIKKIRMRLLALQEHVIKSEDEGVLRRPALIIKACDYSIKMYHYDVEGKIHSLTLSSLGQLTFLGLAKSLSDENDIDLVTQKAFLGKRENVDTQVFEMLDESENSPYGQFPPKLPIFNFGKGMDHNLGNETFSSEDLLDSLVSMILNEILTISVVYNRRFRTINVYFCGEMFNYAAFEKHIMLRLASLNTGMFIKLLKGDFQTALGAIVTDC